MTPVRTGTEGGARLQVLAWPLTSGNPYIADLYRRIEAADPAIEVSAFAPATAWRATPDVVHVHWPEAACSSPRLLHALAKSVAVIATLALHKARGASIIWTCHNLAGHDQRHPRLESMVQRLFDRLVDGVIHLDQRSIERCAQARPRLAGRPTTVVPHGHYGALADGSPDRDEARALLGLDPEATVLASVGMIRPYKNIPALIEAVRAMRTEASLLVAGSADDPAERQRVETAAGGDPRIELALRWLDDDELATRIRAADAVVLAYRNVHNSGAAILALSLGRPVVVTPNGAMAGLANAVGEDWVHLLTEPLDGPVLDRLAAWARNPRPDRPDLSSLDPDRAAALTAQFFRRIDQGDQPTDQLNEVTT